MSAFHDNALIGASGQQGYNISRSVRYRAGASPYFTRPFATPTNSSKWTMSMWVKRGILSSATTPALFGKTISASANFYLAFDPGNTMTWTFSNTAYMTTTQVFRDPSAWYHIVAVWDSANATAAQRARLYVNGTEVTAFSVDNRSSITTSMDAWNTTNTAYLHGLGCASATVSTVNQFFDGNFAEINFIDGQALTPSSFGESDAVTGVWKPKKYAGTYGTNGFYLNFSDNSSNTAATIGKDYSGNGNNWTPNNISVTAGATYDSMLDVPTLWADGGNGRGNYATLNPLVVSNAAPISFSEANLRVDFGSSSTGWSHSTIGMVTGKWYAEFTLTSVSSTNAGVGLKSDTSLNYAGFSSNSYAYENSGNKRTNDTTSAYGASYTNGDVIGVAYDADAGTLTFYKNNTTQGQAFSGITGTNYFVVSDNSSAATCVWQVNFGQRPFAYTPPTGFKALNTQNLPDATIKNGAGYMAATTYTGTGATQTISNSANGVSFQPDLVWTKARSAAIAGLVYDSVRGATKYLQTNSTGAEGTGADSLTAFASNGFTVGADTSTTGVNQNTTTYVGWQWKAGGTSSSNTNGSITSTVSVNTTAGFSVVTWTNPSSGIPTIGHGLGVAPTFIIVKDRTYAYNWDVGCTSIGWANRLNLNTTGATSSGFWNSTAPTSTVFTYSSSGANSGDSMVAYCFAEVAGYSKFGSYTGNGSTDGPFVYLGFRPRFVLVKASSAVENWLILDSSTGAYNVISNTLLPNSSAAESTGNNRVDFLSNGFKARASAGVSPNASGVTYIYAAFAENPFKNALAR